MSKSPTVAADHGELKTRLADIFTRAQTNSSQNRVLTHLLHQLHQTALIHDYKEAFLECFIYMIAKILNLKKSQTSGDRIVLFVSKYVGHICPEVSEDEDSTALEPYYEFAEALIRFCLRAMNSQNKYVRFRAAQLTTSIMMNCSALSAELCETIFIVCLERTRDREAAVRTEIIICLTILDDGDPDSAIGKIVGKVLLAMMQYDSSPEVRRAALINLKKTKKVYGVVCERARDVNPINRKVVFTKIISQIGDFRLLKIDTRERLLKAGLQDRDEAVKKTAKNMLIRKWLPTVDNDLISLLSRLDVLNSEVAEEALDAFFEERKNDLAETLVFDEDFWMNLGAEGAFLVRCYSDFCQKHNLQSLAENTLPDLSSLTTYLEAFWKLYCHVDSDEQSDYEFVIEQLLMLTRSYDFGDEIGRRNLFSMLDSIMTCPQPPSETIIFKITQLYHKTALNDNDFFLAALVLLSDIQDTKYEQSGELSAELVSLLTCLAFIESMLQLAESGIADRTSVDGLISGHIKPALKSGDFSVVSRATKCLCHCCLVNEEIACDNFEKFVNTFEEALIEPTESQDPVLLAKCITDMLLTHVFLPSDKFIGLLRSHLGTTDQDFLATAIECTTKLMLAGVYDDSNHEILKLLLREYFIVNDDSHIMTQQILSFFIPVFAYTSEANQRAVAELAGEVLLKIFAVSDSVDSQVNNTPAKVLEQFIEWTSPFSDTPQRDSSAHVALAFACLKYAKETYSRKNLQRAFVGGLLKLDINPSSSLADLESLKASTVEMAADKRLDSRMHLQLERFSNSMDDAIRAKSRLYASDDAQETQLPQMEE